MNIVTGTASNDTLTGSNAADYIDGAGGADTMTGLDGDDVYIADDPNDVVVEAANKGMDRVNSLVSYTLGANVENLWLVGVANSNGTGNSLANTLWGNGGTNVLDGGQGNDYIDGGAGADTLIGGAGNDTFWVDDPGDVVSENPGEGIDLVNSSLAGYTLPSDVENLTLAAGAGDIDGTGNALDNALTGNSGDNVLDGAGGNDTIDGGVGNDTLIGGAGDDLYRVDSVGDVVSEAGGQGSDSVVSTLANYTLTANVETLTLGANYFSAEALNGTGNGLDNVLRGNRGDNTLDGAGGDDTLVGGDGSDTLSGGAGRDTFSLNTTDIGTDTIADLASGESIQLHGVILSGSFVVGNGTGAGYGDVEIESAAGQTILHVGTDASAGADLAIALNGSYAAGDFHAYGYTLVYDTNHAPAAVDSVANQQTAQDASFALQLPAGLFSDSDGDTLSLSITVLDIDWMPVAAPWLAYDAVTGTLSGTPGSGDVGDYTVVVTATDPSGASASSFFGLTVDPAIVGTSGAGSLAGSTRNDAIEGLGGNDTLSGGAGNDFLDGGAGNDTMLGGSGNDIYVVDSTADRVFETTTAKSTTDAGGIDTVLSSVSWTLGSYVENLTLTGSAASATGNGLANTLTGNAVDNVLDGKAGADTMIGGAGNDTYVVDNTGDTTIESPGQGTDLVRASVTYTLGADIENLTLTGSSGIGGTGNELGNVILGNGGANKLNGREGADSLAGAGGIDTLLGGEGNDSLAGGAGNDVLWGEGGADRFVFDTAIGSSNVDKVMDFNHAEGDVIALSSAIFAGLGATVDANEIRVGAGATAAQTATQHLIYNTTTGNLYYDADGAGGSSAKLIATVDLGGLSTSHPASLGASDFAIF